jgi:2-polyprenyl-3-methyl-5-hydroxy-6-metoxy-1,4-benzoquinol methylase
VHTADGFAPAEHSPGQHGDLYRCSECGTVQQPSLPEADRLHDLYREMSDQRYLLEEEGRRETARRLLDKLTPHVPVGRLLDIGCGYGLLLDEARLRGYDVLGVDLSSDSVRHARDALGLPVLEGTAGELGLEAGTFDAIVMSDVIEHFDDPLRMLQLCQELLAPGGALVIATPDPSSITARLAGARWWSYLLAHHCLLPRRTLRELLEAQGLVLVAEHPYVRVFTGRYWLEGMAGRGGPAAAVAGVAARLLPPGRLLAATMGDDRTYIARRIDVLAPEEPIVSSRGRPRKVHVTIPARNAGQTVARLVDELAPEAADRALLVDDASADATVVTALAAGLEVLPVPAARGHGANRRTCYATAVLAGADVVVVLPGDHPCDPALISELSAPIEHGRADVVIGCRSDSEPVADGWLERPRRRLVRRMAELEAAVFGDRYPENRTGCAAYSTELLRSIAFLRNSDGPRFEQELRAQITASGARVVALTMPAGRESPPRALDERVRHLLGTVAVLVRFRLASRGGEWTLLRRPAMRLAPRPADEFVDRARVPVQGAP